MNTKNWHIPFRSELDLRSIKTRVLAQWFGNPQIGTFRDIAHDVTCQVGISLEDAEIDVARILKKNSTKSLLKPRHVVIAKEMYANGFGAGQIARLLSQIEGMPLSIDVVQANHEIAEWKINRVQENPQMQVHREKSAEIEGPDIKFFRKDHNGVRKVYAVMPIQYGELKYLERQGHKLNVVQREQLVQSLYAVYLGPTKIAEVLTEITGTRYYPYSIDNIFQKLKRESDATQSEFGKGILNRAENQELQVRVKKNICEILTKNGNERRIAAIDIPSAKITWFHNDLRTNTARREIIDQAIISLYTCGVAPKRIEGIIADAYQRKFTNKQVMRAINRGQRKGEVQRWDVGYYHRTDIMRIRTRISGDFIEVYRAAAPHAGTLEMQEPQGQDEIKARIRILDGTIDAPLGQDEQKEMTLDIADSLIARLYSHGITRQQIAEVVAAAYEMEFSPTQVGHRLNMLERAKKIELRSVGTSNNAYNRRLRVRIDGKGIIVEHEGQKREEKMLAKLMLSPPRTGQDQDRRVIDEAFTALYQTGLGRDDIREILQNRYDAHYSCTKYYNKVAELADAKKIEKRPHGQAWEIRTQDVQYRILGEEIIVYREEGVPHWEVVDSFTCAEMNPQEDAKQQPGHDRGTPAEMPADQGASTPTQSGEGERGAKKKIRQEGFETYVRFRWHADPRVGIADALGQDLGIPGAEIRRIVTQRNAWGILKPAHVYLIRELSQARVTPTEITRIIGSIEGIHLSLSPVQTKLTRMLEAGMLPGNSITPDPHFVVEATPEAVQVRDRHQGTLLKTIKLADAAVAVGFDGLYAYPPPTLAQYEDACERTQTMQASFEQIRADGGWAVDTLESLLLHGHYMGDRVAFDNRFLPTLEPAKIDKLVVFARNTDKTITEIATVCGCSRGSAAKYIFQKVYYGNQELYNARFNPPPLTPTQQQTANALAQENRKKEFLNHRSFSSIVEEVGGTFEAVRAEIVQSTYHNNENAFATDYPGGRQDLTPQQVQYINREVSTTQDSIYVIARRLNCSEAAVARVALTNYFDYNYDRYSIRFPEKRVSEAAVAAATELIRDANSSYRSYKAIARKVTAEVAPMSAASVQVRARQILTRAERAVRFKGDPDYRIGQVTHVVAEGLCKRAAERIHVAAYSEVRLRRAHRKEDGPTPTDRQRRWVRADLLLRLEPGQAELLFKREGLSGIPLGEEAGWTQGNVANARELLLELSADVTAPNVQKKNRKYATGRHNRPVKGRLVLYVATADWFGEGRVQGDPDGLPNTRIASLDYVADLLQMSPHERDVVTEIIGNSCAREQAAQERLAEQEGLAYSDDTARWYADQGRPLPDWRGPQQTLDAQLKEVPKIRPERLVEVQDLAQMLQGAREHAHAPELQDAGKDKEGAPSRNAKPGEVIDPAHVEGARAFAKALQGAHEADLARTHDKSAAEKKEATSSRNSQVDPNKKRPDHQSDLKSDGKAF